MPASFLLLFIGELRFFSSGGLPYSQLVHDQVCQEVVAPGSIAGQRLRITHPVTVTIISVIIFCAIGYMWKLVMNVIVKAVKKDLDVSSGKLPAQTIASRAGRDS